METVPQDQVSTAADGAPAGGSPASQPAARPRDWFPVLLTVLVIGFAGYLMFEPDRGEVFRRHAAAITAAEFGALTREPQTTVVLFHAAWCTSCKRLQGLLDLVVEDFEGKVRFVRVDVDAEETLANAHEVTSLPTVEVYRSGKLLGRFTGLRSTGEMTNAFNRAARGEEFAL